MNLTDFYRKKSEALANATLVKRAVPLKRAVAVRSAREKLSQFHQPMLAQIVDKPFDNEDWLFEIKWDGYRAVAEVSKGNVRLYSRNGLSFVDLYAPIADALRKLKIDAMLDGEIVVLDDENKPSFQMLQHYDQHRKHPLVYYVFDCLRYKNKDLTSLPLVERKKILRKILPQNDVVRYSDHIETEGTFLFGKASEMGLEGIIAKKKDSTYTEGKRTADWLKIKNQNTQEAIIAGFTAPRKSRSFFGALILGMRQRGRLVYIGHTGTGFTEKLLKEIYETLRPLIRSTSPFEERVPVNSPVTWVEPVTVCQVKFTEVTRDGILRHPVFMGLRIDKGAGDVDHLDAKPKQQNVAHKIKTPSRRAPVKKEAAKTTARKTATPETSSAQNNVIKNVDGHELMITNVSKVYWPKRGITKGDVIDYYNSVYPYIIPYLKDRPESLKRNPNGITDKGFFQKDAGQAAPAWVKHIPLYSEGAQKDIDYIICNDKATLFYLNNLGCIELNPWNSRIKSLDKPDYLVMDIDPSEANTFDQVIEAALAVKEVLDQAGAAGYCKTSGATGLHIYVPLHAQYDYEHARSFAEIIARLAEEKLPRTTTTERSLSKRKDRIYLDYLQNKKGQTLAVAYSLRPVEAATVSTPLHWKEVRPGLHPSDFTLGTMAKRLAKTGDIFANVLKEKTNLESCLKKLGA